MGMFPVDPSDEGQHPPGDEPFWGESWYLDFFSPDGSIGGYLRIGRYPNLGVIWYWACVVGPDRPLVTVIDHSVPLPRSGSFEVRHDGLWADYTVETPIEHISVGLEAFGVALDDPAETYRGLRGDRTPLGFDLEWELDGEDFMWPAGLDRYEIPCRVHGEVLVGSERIELDGFGQRDHSWGIRDWWANEWCWTAFRLDDGSRWHAVDPRSVPFAMGYVQEPGRDLVMVAAATAEETLGTEGIPTKARLSVEQHTFEVTPLAWSPVLLVDPDGREARFPRALARFSEVTADAGTGRTGLGWIEFNQLSHP